MAPASVVIRPYPDRERGLTLTGLMVGLAVGSIVLTAALSTYLMISESASDTLADARLNQELSAALAIMSNDIRRAGFWDFKDANGDGDANADGVFDARDLGDAFDTDSDGDSDAQDLSPLNNPFQRRYASSINNDLCTDTDAETGDCSAARCLEHDDSGACTTYVQSGTCITYSYDLDADARIGIRACDRADGEDDCPRPTGPDGGAPFAAPRGEPYAWRSWYPPNEEHKTKSIEMEMFGFRYRNGGIDMRVGRFGTDDLVFGCNAGRWERITSPDIRVTRFEVQLITSLRNANPGKPETAPCETGDLCRQVRSVDLTLDGQLADDPSVTRSLSTTVSVRNDRYLVTQ